MMVLRWERLLILQLHLRVALSIIEGEISECFRVNGADYQGQQNRTSVENGIPCLYWNETGRHAYNTLKYPNGEWGLGNHNYCRNPDGDVQPWCYVSETEEGIYWKYCNIPSCSMPGYVGCFYDSGEPPVLSGSSGTSTKLTVQVCIRFCRRKGYKYAGVEAGYACFCGNDMDLSNRRRANSVQCDQVCFGKSSELCGGDGHIGIYDVSVGACSGNTTSPKGVIYSPDFPDHYGPESNCTWTVRPEGAVGIRLEFRLFEVPDPGDRLVIRDGDTDRVLASFSGATPPPATLTLHTPSIALHFRSNQILHAQGFGLRFTGLQANVSQGGDGLPWTTPTLSDRQNVALSPASVTSLPGSIIYSMSAIFGSVGLLLLYHLWKRNSACSPVKLVVAEVSLIPVPSVMEMEAEEEEEVGGNGAYAWPTRGRWSADYGGVPGRGELPDEVGEGYGQLTPTGHTSLRSLLSASAS